MSRVWGLLLIVTLIAGLTPMAARLATHELPPLSIPLVRFGTAGVLLAVTVKLLRLGRPIPRVHWPLLVGLGFLCVPLNQIGYLIGIKKANASHAGIAYALVPVLVYWISVLLRRSALTLRLSLASVLAFAGAAVVDLSTAGPTTADAASLRDFLIGDVLLVSAAVSWSLFVVLSQPLVRELGAVLTLSCVFLMGTVWQTPLVLADWRWFDLAAFDVSQVTWRGWTGLAFITLVTAYVNYLLWYIVTARFDVTRSAVVTNAHFLVTVLVEAAFFGQRLNTWVFAGSAVLLSGIVLATREATPFPEQK
jgi:drug/metabolite transporter (DMT)-like permease